MLIRSSSLPALFSSGGEQYLRCLIVQIEDLPIFGLGHSLGSVIHLLIGTAIFFSPDKLLLRLHVIGNLEVPYIAQMVGQVQDMLFKEMGMY